MTRQLSFDLPARAALGRGDFFVAPGNAVAVAMIEDWARWPGGKLVLAGPAGSGKTHLAHVWAAESGARLVSARDLAAVSVPDLATGAVGVEDVPDIAGDPDAEAALFHLHNFVLAAGHPLLMTGTGDPSRWGIALPDLASRIAATTVAMLDAPDDALLSAVLTKLFADRQIAPAPEVVPYLVRHMERSFDVARDVVAALDTLALAEARPVTRPLAQRVLDGHNG